MTIRRLASRTYGTDDGLMTIEFVLWTPLLALVLLFVVAAGRIVEAGSYAESAAADAARAASLQRDRAGAQTAAETAARRTLGRAGISCDAFSVTMSGSVLSGQVVVVRVACTTPLGDLVPGLPGSHTLHASASAPIEETRQ